MSTATLPVRVKIFICSEDSFPRAINTLKYLLKPVLTPIFNNLIMEIGTGLLSTFFFFLIPFYTLLLYTLLLYLLTPVTVIPKSDKNQRNSCDPKSEKKRGEEKKGNISITNESRQLAESRWLKHCKKWDGRQLACEGGILGDSAGRSGLARLRKDCGCGQWGGERASTAPAASGEASEGAATESVTAAANGEAASVGGGRAGVDGVGGGFFVV